MYKILSRGVPWRHKNRAGAKYLFFGPRIIPIVFELKIETFLLFFNALLYAKHKNKINKNGIYILMGCRKTHVQDIDLY